MKAVTISSEKNCGAASDTSTLFWLLLLKKGTRPHSRVILKPAKGILQSQILQKGIDVHILLERLQLNVEIIE